jgi:nucleoside-diphosphate-sugar epimerase
VKAALLGGGGYISTAVRQCLEAAGHAVTDLRRSPSPGAVCGDRYDAAALASLADTHFDVIIDFLCYQPEHARQLRQAFAGKTGKVIMISTGSVYWCTGTWQNPVGEDQFFCDPVPESAPTPLTPGSVEYAYGLGKRQAEEVLAAAQEAGEFQAVRLRFPAVGGPADPTGRYAGYVGRLGDGDPLLIPDGGFNTFRHVYVKDAAAAVLAAMEHPGPGQGWNIASREIFSVRDLVREMAACMGRPEPVVVAPPRAWLAQHGNPDIFAPFSAVRDQILDIRAAQADLNFTPTPWSRWLAATVSTMQDLPRPRQRVQELETVRLFERTLAGAPAYIEAGEVS